MSPVLRSKTLFEDLVPAPVVSQRGRITLYCIAESLERRKLEELLKFNFALHSIKVYPDAFYLEYLKSSEDRPCKWGRSSRAMAADL